MAAPAQGILQRFKFSTEAYHKMGDYGLLPENVRIELLDGEIVEMSPINSPHSGTVNRLQKILEKMLGKTHVISNQNPLHISAFSEPEPDIAVLKWRDDFYFDKHPIPEEVFLLIEVADSSFSKDQEIKMPLYAQAGIQELWIINLQAKNIEVYCMPEGKKYTQVKVFQPGDSMEGTLIPSLKFDQILPR